MGDGTGIEWTDATWNPIRGCTRVSEGCRHCYAEQIAARFSGPGLPYDGLAHKVGGEARWTGEIAFAGMATLDLPLRWKRPRMIFVNSMSDLFHPRVTAGMREMIWTRLQMATWHIFQVLTKRPDAMRTFLIGRPVLPNVWWGVSVEDQVTASDRRIDMLRIAEMGHTTWVSYEPALGHVVWKGWEFIKWLVSGGESGKDARPSHPEWHRSALDYCQAVRIPYLFKQWGAWAETDEYTPGHEMVGIDPDIAEHDCAFDERTAVCMAPIGKSRAGRLLDGRTWDEYPDRKVVAD